MMRRPLLSLGLVAALLGVTHRAAAQEPQSTDTLRLGDLQDAAVGRDPRGRQLDLLASQSAMRLEAIRREWRPQFDVTAYARYQSEVASIPFDLPGDVEPFTPPKDTYDAHLGVRQPLYEPTLGPRRSVESAQLAESQARVRTTLFSLRESVAESYFMALLLQAQGAELEAGLTELEAQLRVARGRVEAGEALPSETATLEAELVRRRQSLAEVAADRGAALGVLSDLTGRPVREQDALGLPDLEQKVSAARAGLASVRERPEYAEFARTREALDRRAAEIGRRNWPRLSAVGRAGVGRPGLNPLGDEFASYWLVGVQLDWSPWYWGRSGLERQSLDIQQQIVATEEAAFTERVRRGTVRDLAAIDRLAESLDADSAIIALRERVLDEARLRFSEGVITSDDFVDRETDLLSARLTRAAHRVELAQARAHFLTLVGIEVP